MKNMEIERKFLPDRISFDIEKFPHRNIKQGYLSTEPVVRVRMDDKSYILTYKSKGLMERVEYDLPLTESSFYKLLAKCDGRIIEKTRYILPIEGYDSLQAELDIFHGELEGLVLLEVEFATRKDAMDFIPPMWFGKEVTNDEKYHNSYLSQK